MRPLHALILLRIRSLRNQALALHRDDLAKGIVVAFGLILVTAVTYQVSYWSFRFIEGFPAIGPPLNERLLALLFLVLLVMVSLSTAVIVYATLFLAAETEFLLSHPVPPRLAFFARLAESVAFSAWATLLLGLPVLAAFGRARGAGLFFHIESAAVLIIFLVFCGFLGSILMFILLEIIRHWTWRRFALVGLVLVGVPAWLFIRSFDIGGLRGDESLQVLDRFTAGITAIRSPFFPGHWAAAAVISASTGHGAEVLFQGGLLLANTLIFIPLLSAYGRFRYSSRWLLARDLSSPSAKAPDGASRRKPVTRAWQFSFRSTPGGALSWKDSLTFVRDPAQLSQFFLFLILLAVYIVSLLRIPSDLFGEGWRRVIYFANLGAISLILSSFSSRFLFPLLSLEGRCFWIVGLAPMEREYLVRQKLAFGATVIIGLGTIASISSNIFLGFRGWPLATAIYVILLEGWCLTALSAGLGAAYPSLAEENPARIAVGLGGTLNFFASAAAIALIILIEGAPYLLFRYPPRGAAIAAHAVAFSFTAVLSAYVLRLGRRSIREMEF